MAIYDPIPGLEVRRERLLFLLSKLLNEAILTDDQSTNKNKDFIYLSYEEERELSSLLGDLSESRDFFIKLSFVDGVAGFNGLSEDHLREIYLSERKRLGRTRVLASKQWADFLARIGSASGWSRWGVSTSQMTFAHFLEMEQRLFAALKFPTRVNRYLIQKVSETEALIGRSLENISKKIPRPAIEFRTRDLVAALIENLGSGRHVSNLSTNQIAGLTITISNLAVLFTTRDWSAAGTISAMSGGVIQWSAKDR